MYAAVAQFAVVEIGFLGTFPCQFRHACHGLALMLALLYLAFYHLRHVCVDVQIVVDLLFHEVTDELVDALSTRTHGKRTEFYLCL